MKKLVAFALASVMLCSSMTAFAAEYDPPKACYLTPESDVGNEKITLGAIEEGKEIAEYMNNFVDSAWDMPKNECITVGQGGNVIVDGKQTSLTYSVLETDCNYSGSAKLFAARNGGTARACVRIGIPSDFHGRTAVVNFYTPGVTADRNIKVYRYIDYNTWEELTVNEVRTDHIVATLTTGGVIAFVEY